MSEVETLVTILCGYCGEATDAVAVEDEDGYACTICGEIAEFTNEPDYEYDPDDGPECPQFWDGTGPNFW